MTSQATMLRETRDPESTVPVLVVGGGLAGLSTALFLSWHGIRPLLVERHPDLLIHPRARGFTPRTIELFRQVGLEPAIKAASYAEGDSFRWTAVRADSLAAEHFPVEEPSEDADMGQLSPAPFGWIDQDKLEIILRDKARDLGADVRFATELVSFVQDDNGVTATLEDRATGATTTVRASYLVAADGWDSGIREQLAIPLDGPGPFFNVITALVTADLQRALRGRPVNIAYLQQPRPGTMLMAHDEAGQRWVFGTGFSPQHGESAADFDEARIVELVRAAAGLPDIDVALRPQIPGTDVKVLGFAIGAHLARAYRSGRVFLVGDAAHIVPPTGGFGANTGIQDAHNLAWKLALVLHGEATDRLLDSYQTERHAAGLLTMQQALARWGDRVGAGREGEDQFLDYSSVVFGYIYRSDAVVGAPGGDEAALAPAALHAQPGTRAPHVWLTGQEGPASTIDLYGRGFVLLTDSSGTHWRDAAKSLTEPRVAVICIGADGDLGDPEGEWARTYAVEPGGAVLIRPDGFVGWRATGMSANPEGELAAALAQITGHGVRSAVNC